jgi:hypothetical protein
LRGIKDLDSFFVQRQDMHELLATDFMPEKLKEDLGFARAG